MCPCAGRCAAEATTHVDAGILRLTPQDDITCHPERDKRANRCAPAAAEREGSPLLHVASLHAVERRDQAPFRRFVRSRNVDPAVLSDFLATRIDLSLKTALRPRPRSGSKRYIIPAPSPRPNRAVMALPLLLFLACSTCFMFPSTSWPRYTCYPAS